MKSIFRIAVLLLSVTSLHATIPSYRVVPDVVYGHKAGMALTYDVVIPTDSSNGAGVIHIVSAGWRSEHLRLDSVDVFYAPILEKGYTLFILRHGSSPWFKMTDIVKDVQDGVAHISGHARDYDVDPARLGIYGGSAGGQLALLTGTMHEHPPVAAVVAFYPPADLRGIPSIAAKMYPALDVDSTVLAAASPVAYVNEGDAPTLLVHGDIDYFVPIRLSESMYDTLAANNVPARFVLMPGMMHGGMFGGKGKFFDRTTAEMLNWFDTYLLPPARPDSVSADHHRTW